MNFTRISPTIPTLGFLISSNSISSNSLTILRIFLLNSRMVTLSFVNCRIQIFFHFSCRAFTEPGTFSYGRVRYTTFMNTSPYTTACMAFFNIGSEYLKPELDSRPCALIEITGIYSSPAFVSARRINPM